MDTEQPTMHGRGELDAVAFNDWLQTNWSPDLTLRQWWSLLADNALAFPTWPAEYGGRGWARAELAAISRALANAGAIGPPTGLGTLMGAPVVLQFGTDEQKRRLLPPLADGTEGWCQLFSEPGAGSDLASVSTSATRDGDEWMVSGQKVWTSGSMDSARGMLIARSDADQPKYRGITYFIIDMRQPGVTIRPIRQMNGRSHFSEVFFDDARVHDHDRIGNVNEGWAIALATLGFERSGLSAPGGVPGVRPSAGEFAGLLDRTCRSIIDSARTDATVPDDAGGSIETLLELARVLHRDSDPTFRQTVARGLALDWIADYTQQRVVAASRSGKPVGPEASLAKLAWTERLQLQRDIGTSALGANGMVTGSDTPGAGIVQHFALTIPSARIAGGSDEVQRNIIGERVLGLAKEPMPDVELPFRQLRRS